ncbi:mitochondrial fission factor homolog B isoform X8 [Electrophorus electricus]|uniref:Mitochondrial fission factor n=1 Tax=Electrophorus electricus TaxID=8005 RepID=A0A4W4E817_ELEEL|nr:mitochondrial fission factor homolog B isoform X8 [Electrophorus electricus]
MDPALEKMSRAAFPSPTAEMAEMNRIHYELEYTEDISQRMRIPDMLKVTPFSAEGQDSEGAAQEAVRSALMQVPDRIVVTGNSEAAEFSRPRDLDLIQSSPLETLSLKTPPRVLTLNERPLDFLELEQSAVQASEETRSQGRSRRERSVSENTAVRHNGPLSRNDSLCALSTLDMTMDGGVDDMAVVDASTLRRQIIKLNRRLLLLEEENKERAKREMIMYSVTVVFWLINSWVWFRR